MFRRLVLQSLYKYNPKEYMYMLGGLGIHLPLKYQITHSCYKHYQKIRDIFSGSMLEEFKKYNKPYKHINHLHEKAGCEPWTEIDFLNNTCVFYKIIADIFGTFPEEFPLVLSDQTLFWYYKGLIDTGNISQFQSNFLQLLVYNYTYIPKTLFLAALSISNTRTIIQLFRCLNETFTLSDYSIRMSTQKEIKDKLFDGDTGIILKVLKYINDEDCKHIPPTKIGPAEYIHPNFINYLYNMIIHSYGDQTICDYLFSQELMTSDHHLKGVLPPEFLPYHPNLIKLYMLALLRKSGGKACDPQPQPQTQPQIIMYTLDILLDISEVIHNNIANSYKSRGVPFDKMKHKLSSSDVINNVIIHHFIKKISFGSEIPTDLLEIIKSKFLRFMSSLMPKQYWIIIFGLIKEEKYDIMRFLNDTIFTEADVEYLISEISNNHRGNIEKTNIIKCLMVMGYSLNQMDLLSDIKPKRNVEQLEEDILDYMQEQTNDDNEEQTLDLEIDEQ